MMNKYSISKENIYLLEKSGIIERISRVDKDVFPKISYEPSKSDIGDTIRYLKEGDFLDGIKGKEQFQNRYLSILDYSPESVWKINRSGKEEKIPTNYAELRIFLGEYASHVLGPDEIWDHERFGFRNGTDFVTTVSVYIINNILDIEDGYTWFSDRSGGEYRKFRVTKTNDADFRVHQENHDICKTIDPFGNENGCRPIAVSAKDDINAYHSVEAGFFGTLLRYIDQIGFEPEIFKDGGKELIAWIKKNRGIELSANEINPDDLDNEMEDFLQRFNYKITKFDGNKIIRPFYFNISCSPGNGDGYRSYIGDEDELIIAIQNNDREDVRIVSRFYPKDIEHLMKGILSDTKGPNLDSIIRMLELKLLNKDFKGFIQGR
ncbi:MAG: hypothetical protein PHS92_03285 [Candidatus Gracilibacteria bacterium]|nr:hypothetical protein [Candidatus Gracilibacteria bacterium]